METQTLIPNSTIDLQDQAWRHVVHTFLTLLPPPVSNTPEALRARNHAAIGQISALNPVNANEAELAAQCVAARAQAEEMLRLTRVHANDVNLVIKLNAQYTALVRVALAAQGHLLREQKYRHKRESVQGNADIDEWTRHIAANSMLAALPAEPEAPAAPKSTPESHAAENETPMRQSSNPIAVLHPTRTSDLDTPEGYEDIDIAGGWPIHLPVSPGIPSQAS